MTQSARKPWRPLDYLALVAASVTLAAAVVVWLVAMIIPGETPDGMKVAIVGTAGCTFAIGYWGSKQPEWRTQLAGLLASGAAAVIFLSYVFDGDGTWLWEALFPLTAATWFQYLTHRPKRALLLLLSLCILACVVCVALATSGGLIPQLMFGHESQGLAVLVWMWLSFVPLALIAVVLAVAERISTGRSSKG